MKKKSLHLLLIGFCLLSYGWLFTNLQFNSSLVASGSICIFKNVTSLPCPACGTTRSVMSIYQGNISQAALYNPLGFLAVIILIIVPFWMLYDVISGKSSLFNAYYKMELQLKSKLIAIPLIGIVLVNWIWNIMKGL
jgi:hypothetical protein